MSGVMTDSTERKSAMTMLMLDLPPEMYEQLRDVAQQTGRPAADVVIAQLGDWLDSLSSGNKRERSVLRAAGLVAYPSSEMLARAAQATMSLTEVRAALDRVGGQPLSELIIDMRGLKP